MKEPKCKLEEEWGYISKNVWYFKLHALSKLDQHECFYRAIRMAGYNKYAWSKWIDLYHNATILEEVFEVMCRLKATSFRRTKPIKYNSLFAQIVNKFKKVNIVKETLNVNKKPDCRPLDVILLSLDSVSRKSWIKRLPKTYKYILRTMKFELLEGYNIVGDGTPGI